ncbi:hypothetical protein D9M69_691710 [compost metagenome]
MVAGRPARISTLTSASSSASSAWLTAISSATRSMAWGKARPDSTHTTMRSRASGNAARRRFIRASLRLSTNTAGASQPTPSAPTAISSAMAIESFGSNGISNRDMPSNSTGSRRRMAQYICTAEFER